MDVPGLPGDERRARLSEELKARGGLRPFAESFVTHDGSVDWGSSRSLHCPGCICDRGDADGH